MSAQSENLLQVENLTVRFPLRGRDEKGLHRSLLAVDDVSFAIKKGETLGIVGESGSGKTTAAMATARLIKAEVKKIMLDGIDFHRLDKMELRKARQKIQIIFQDPYSSLNPRLRAAQIVCEPLKHLGGKSKEQQDEIIEQMFKAVGLRQEQKPLFPHQFSGGQRQRIGIARALATKPSLVICDEPVSALDVAVQAQILNLLQDLQKKFNLTYLFISHDLGVIQHMCDYIAVMYMGRIIEFTSKKKLFLSPSHPYSKALLAAVPTIGGTVSKVSKRKASGDELLDFTKIQKGCRFAPRCPIAVERCHLEAPALRKLHKDHKVACHFAV